MIFHTTLRWQPQNMYIGLWTHETHHIAHAYNITYRQISNIRHNKSQNMNVARLVLQLSLLNPLKRVLSWEWRCSWSIACRRCSNYIWVISNFLPTKQRLILEVSADVRFKVQWGKSNKTLLWKLSKRILGKHILNYIKLIWTTILMYGDTDLI